MSVPVRRLETMTIEDQPEPRDEAPDADDDQNDDPSFEGSSSVDGSNGVIDVGPTD